MKIRLCFLTVSVIFLLITNCTTLLLHKYPANKAFYLYPYNSYEVEALSTHIDKQTIRYVKAKNNKFIDIGSRTNYFSSSGELIKRTEHIDNNFSIAEYQYSNDGLLIKATITKNSIISVIQQFYYNSYTKLSSIKIDIIEKDNSIIIFYYSYNENNLEIIKKGYLIDDNNNELLCLYSGYLLEESSRLLEAHEYDLNGNIFYKMIRSYEKNKLIRITNLKYENYDGKIEFKYNKYDNPIEIIHFDKNNKVHLKEEITYNNP